MSTLIEQLGQLRSQSNMLTRPSNVSRAAVVAAFAAGRVESLIQRLENRDSPGPDSLSRARRAYRVAAGLTLAAGEEPEARRLKVRV